ncbi:MAG: thioredoxin domain-containing protein [Balneolaceae bacterium]|nr:thioredoxin domain-containing protein [Balneolaceae bacterium]MCH8547246.1 thioredoxin domain-containing protein [Balneolaceae bacterium]
MNRLSKEKSPYLLQHAGNPVDWYPWGDEAFEHARKEDKPVFLSIGYATCHWCHVMEHESFEDDEVARLMNETFINIKVDREERPDIDNTYMTVCQMLTGSGGWPLTVILTPEKMPFYAATYIPRESAPGRIGMKQLVPAIQNAWKNDRKNVLDSADKVRKGFEKTLILGKSTSPLPDGLPAQSAEALERRFDQVHGGFGGAPKFPSPHNLLFLYGYSEINKERAYGELCDRTLSSMALGGIHDHVGGGFHRYSVDSQWLLPHFEKMLYDQANMLLAYSQGWNLSGNDLFRDTAYGIIQYIEECLTSPSGAFYSAEDADSEGEEGKFYVWQIDEVRAILEPYEADFFEKHYNLDETGNFADEATGERTGANIPHLKRPLTPEETKIAEPILKKLHQLRKERMRPLLDDKILTDWNGLMIGALANAGVIFEDEELIKRAERAYAVIETQAVTSDNRLWHRLKDGEASISGMADDYAFMIFASIELWLATFKPLYLKTALDLQAAFDQHFFDEETGGYFFTPDDGESLLGRQKELYDGAAPSSNSMAAYNGFRLSRLTGNPDFEARARSIFDAFSEPITDAPAGYTFAMHALQLMNANSFEIVICSSENPDSEIVREAIKLSRKMSPPGSSILLKTPKTEQELNSISEFTSHYPADRELAVYVCSGFSCKKPVYTIEDLTLLLKEK